MTGRSEGFADKAEPAAVDDREQLPAARERLRIDGDMTGLRILDQLILDDVRQRLTQPRAAQRRQRGGHHQQVAGGDHQHRRRGARQQRERRAAGALGAARLVEQHERQLRQLPFLRWHRRVTRRQ